jgi:hypothetical protein
MKLACALRYTAAKKPAKRKKLPEILLLMPFSLNPNADKIEGIETKEDPRRFRDTLKEI